MNTREKLLITGASGFTGQHACKHFQKAGFEVTAVTMKNSYTQKGLHVESCDLTNQDNVKNLVKKTKPQYLLHLAGQNHVGQSWIDPVYSLEVNSLSTAYLIDAVREQNASCKIVVVGSALQFDPTSMSTLTHPYSLSKTLQALIAHSWAILYNMHIVIAKPTNLIGPGFSNGVCSIFAQKIVAMEEHKSNKVLEVNNLNEQRDFLDVRDAVNAYDTLLTKGTPGETYVVASGRNRSLEEILNAYRAITGVEFTLKTKSDDAVEKRNGIPPLKLNKLGWQPHIPFESSLSDIINFYRSKK